mgnify:CR=1 FL=1
MSCRVYILLLLVPLDTLQVAYGRNCTRQFHCRMLYSTYVFTSFLLEVKVIFNLTYAKLCFACQSYIRLKVYFFKTAVTSDYNSNTLTIWFIIWFNPYARLRCLTNDAIRVERSISLLSFPYKIEKSLYLVLLKRNFSQEFVKHDLKSEY